MNVIINGKPYEVTSGLTILDAASSVGIQIPTLCYLKDINKIICNYINGEKSDADSFVFYKQID